MKPETPRISEYLTPVYEWPDEDELDCSLFEDLDLPNEDMHGREFNGCILRRCRLNNADLRRASFVDVVFDHCDLSGVRMEDVVCQRVRFDNCRMTGADMISAVLRNTVIASGKADYLNLSGAKLDHVLMDHLNMQEAALEGCTLRQVEIKDCDLTRTTIAQTPMKGVDLRSDVLDGIIVGIGDLRGMIVTAEQAADLARLLGLVIR